MMTKVTVSVATMARYLTALNIADDLSLLLTTAQIHENPILTALDTESLFRLQN